MILIVCIDDAGGMMFNHRRQSQDRVLRARLLDLAKGSRLWVTPYTAKQFGQDAEALCVSQTPWLDAAQDDYYFAEDGEIPMERVQTVYLYRWNRLYPNDRSFEPDLSALGFAPVHSEEFAGYSHETITEERYEKEF